ncbi:MAG TPA: hypothetical protein VGD37_40355 [Kofleriaceae bacterium]
MKKTASRKLVVSPTTIRNLNAPQIVRVAGGEPPDCTFACPTGVPTKP